MNLLSQLSFWRAWGRICWHSRWLVNSENCSSASLQDRLLIISTRTIFSHYCLPAHQMNFRTETVELQMLSDFLQAINSRDAAALIQLHTIQLTPENLSNYWKKFSAKHLLLHHHFSSLVSSPRLTKWWDLCQADGCELVGDTPLAL